MPVRYTVKQVSSLTGVSPDLLRAWERRYGVVEPNRSPSGYRHYGEDDVARLSRMAELVDGGAPASLAAEQVLAEFRVNGASQNGGGDDAREEGQRPWVPREIPSAARPPLDGLVGPARDFDRAALDRVLDSAFAVGSFEAVFDDWLTPALIRLGQAWESGEIDVAGEHFVSGSVQRRLSRAFEAAGGAAVGAPVVLVGLPAGAHHELAALALATCLRRRGVDVRYLGSNVPVDSWVSAVRRLSPSAVAISVPLEADGQAALDLVRTLAEDWPAARTFVGGQGSTAGGADEFATVLDGPVTKAAHDLAHALAS